jgi:hypothetical protein
MRTTFLYRASYYLLTFMLAPALMAVTRPKCAAGPPTPESYTWNFPQEASTLLQNVKQQDSHVLGEVGTLQQLSRDGDGDRIGWQSAATTLNQIRDHVNDMDGMLCRLRTIRRVALPWQQQAIDRLAPHLIELTDYTQSALTYLNRNQEHPYMYPFQQDVEYMWLRADGIYNSVNQYEEYAADLHQVQQLNRRLDLKTTS